MKKQASKRSRSLKKRRAQIDYHMNQSPKDLMSNRDIVFKLIMKAGDIELNDDEKEFIRSYKEIAVAELSTISLYTDSWDAEEDIKNGDVISMEELFDHSYWKKKYNKCIDVIKRFDPGIIGMYDL